MRKGRFLQIATALGIAMASICAPAAEAGAQSLALEFKAGGAATSTINNSCPGKKFKDMKPGVTIGAGIGFIMPSEMLRIYAEGFYTTKGEKYALSDGSGTMETDICYFHFYPNARFYSPYIPIYIGGGLYVAGGGGRKVKAPESTAEAISSIRKQYYKRPDMGARAAIGGEFGVGTMRLTLEGAYEYGFMNICNMNGVKIQNQCLSITLGLSFMLHNKYWRHY